MLMPCLSLSVATAYTGCDSGSAPAAVNPQMTQEQMALATC